MSLQPVPGQPISAPPEFPVSFEPNDQQGFWTTDRMHFPRPISPMTGAFPIDHGINESFRTFGVPLAFRSKRINTYHYDTVTPTAASPQEAAEAGKRTEQMMGAVIARLDDYWNAEMLPQVKEHLAFLEGFDLAGASLPALRAHLDETVNRFRQLWAIHFRTVQPAYLAISLFDELYRDLFGSGGAFGAYRLTQGLDNLTVKAGRELWRLSRRARSNPEARRVLETEAASDVIPALERTVEGREFLTEFQAYLAVYGERGGEFFEFADKSLLEEPTPLIKSLKDFVGQPDRDVDAELAAAAEERERLVDETRAALQGYPEPVRGQFEMLLRAAQAGTVISEDHSFYIDYKGNYQVRRVLLEAGRRLVEAGTIESTDDVFMLDLEELRHSLADPAAIDRRSVVVERRAEMERFSRVTPPPALGTLPPGSPPDNPMSRANTRFFGGPPPPQTEPGLLRGNPGSPGKVVARARVLHNLSDSTRLRPGEVLVAETTAPPWTPLFASAAAVVTDTGGVLSHCAVVAREYRIPAVVGIGTATTVIRDGQLIEVDGDAGTVRILE